MSQALRKITGVTSKSNTCVIFTNQLRSKIGVVFGNPETTTGGNALKFYASVRLDIRRIGAVKEGNDVVGSRVKVKVVKSKVAPPFKEVEFDILFNEGISKAGELIDLGIEHGVIQKSGAWLTFEGDRFQGREQLKTKLKEDPELMAKLEKQVKIKLGMIKPEDGQQEEPSKKSKSEKAK
jgi:recombination protein RecA